MWRNLHITQSLEVFLIVSKDLIIPIRGLVQLLPNVAGSPGKVRRDKEKSALLIMDRRKQTNDKSLPMVRADKPPALHPKELPKHENHPE